jgi:hypothetical protein
MNAQLRERLYSRLRAEFGADSIERLAKVLPSLIIPEGLRLSVVERMLLIDAIDECVERSGSDELAMEFMGMYLLDAVDDDGRIDNVKAAAHLLAGAYGDSPNNRDVFQAVRVTAERASSGFYCSVVTRDAKSETDFLCCHMGMYTDMAYYDLVKHCKYR